MRLLMHTSTAWGRRRSLVFHPEWKGPAMMESSRFRYLLLERIPDLRAFSMCLLPRQADADALVGNVLVEVWSDGPPTTPDKLRKRLFTLLHKEFHSTRRRLAWAGLGKRPWPEAESPMSCDRGDDSAFGRALHGLPENEREAILLVGACDFSCEETAEICGCEPEMVMKRVESAFARLREALDLSPKRVTVEGTDCAPRQPRLVRYAVVTGRLKRRPMRAARRPCGFHPGQAARSGSSFIEPT